MARLLQVSLRILNPCFSACVLLFNIRDQPIPTVCLLAVQKLNVGNF